MSLFLISLAVGSALFGCAPPPEEEPGVLVQAEVILRDKEVFRHISVFELRVYEATSAGVSAITCDQFPSVYQGDEPQLVQVAALSVRNTWNDPPRAAVLEEPVRVPLDEPLLFVVRGLSPEPNGVFTVARGCAGSVTFDKAAPVELTIDVKATTGAPCATAAECEPTLSCLDDLSQSGGYCARTGCGGGGQPCPPGAACVAGSAAGMTVCARRCTTIADCETNPQAQVCEGRLGLTSSGCANVCVFPLWNPTNKCP